MKLHTLTIAALAIALIGCDGQKQDEKTAANTTVSTPNAVTPAPTPVTPAPTTTPAPQEAPHASMSASTPGTPAPMPVPQASPYTPTPEAAHTANPMDTVHPAESHKLPETAIPAESVKPNEALNKEDKSSSH